MYGTSTASIGGGLLGAGACASTVTLIPTVLSTTTDSVIATPRVYPGDSAYWKAVISRVEATSSDVTTYICEAVAGTPTASVYNLIIQRMTGL